MIQWQHFHKTGAQTPDPNKIWRLTSELSTHYFVSILLLLFQHESLASQNLLRGQRNTDVAEI